MSDSDTCSVSTSFLANIKLGDRVECLGSYGTVRYIGEVTGHASIWLGIDWDDPARGKHDGTVNGHTYFQASCSTSGSFVRPGKVKTGQDAVLAITSRYGKKENEQEALINRQELLNLQREINAPFLTMVGFEKVNEKQSNFKDLKVIILRMQLVKSPGLDGELSHLCPNIQELDISKNLISNWKDIFNICQQLKHLHWLNISENLLLFPENLSEYNFPLMKTLICGYMNLTWTDVLKISKIFPNLQEIRLPYNKIKNIQIDENHNFKSLKLLDIEGNELETFSEICKLGIIDYLEQLNISSTMLKRIEFEDDLEDGKLKIFTELKQLIISDNQIDNWESISELNKLKNLQHLKFLKNPILDTENAATCYQLIIARISNLKILNGTMIKPEDHKGAEYDYIKKQGLEWLQVKNNEEMKKAFLKKHPRYLEIITKYGELEESELTSKAPSLKTSLTSVEIYCGDRILSKKLPSSMTLQKLIMLVQKLFQLPERPALCYVSSDRPDMEIVMDDEFKEIGFYSLQNGDRIYVK